MPTYLCHGFRWQRRSVRVYIILQNLDDASPEWIIPATSSRCILKSFYEIFDFLPYCSPKQGCYAPTRELDGENRTTAENRSRSRGRGRSQSQNTRQSRSQSRASQHQPLPPIPVPPPVTDGSSSSSSSSHTSSPEDDFSAQSWSAIKLLEEYDPHDLTAVSRPYAYVADYAVRIDLSCSIVDEISRYEQLQHQSAYPAISIPTRNPPAEGQGWFEQLRDQLQRSEEIRWYVVVNGDEVRDWPNEPSEPESISQSEQGFQYRRQPKHQQQEYYQYRYRPQPVRPLPTREQRQHHAQYIHQQLIFEGGDRQMEQAQGQKLALEMSNQQQRIQDQQQTLGWRKEHEIREEWERAQQRQGLALKQQEPKGQQVQDWQRRKARAREEERQRDFKREWERNRKREEEKDRQRPQNPSLNVTDVESRPPMVPEKDCYHFHRSPTANNNNRNTPPLRPKMSFDAAVNGRPKTPGSKGGGLRRFFGRAKADVVS